MSRSIKVAAWTAFTLSAIAFLFSGLVFINNIFAVINWWKAFLEAGRAVAVSGLIPELDWSVVDYSTVTTLIPFLGFGALTLSVLRLVSGKKLDPTEFPFFRGSDQLMVALGLLGTLWGIVIIGYYDLTSVTMADLMQCLHTALFSTLMAVVWVFIIDHSIIRPIFQKLMVHGEQVKEEEESLADAVDAFVQQLKTATAEFAKNQATYEETFNRRLAELDAAIQRRQRQAETAFATSQKEFQEEFDKRSRLSREAFEKERRAYHEFFERRIAELEKDALASRQKLAAILTAVKSAL